MGLNSIDVIKHAKKKEVLFSDLLPRHPARIKRILSKLEEYWSAAPELRLCQIISCCRPFDFEGNDLFYLEDEILENELDRLMD